MVNKKLVVIVTIIAIIIVCGIIYINLKREFQDQYTFSEQTVENEEKNNTDNNIEKNTQMEENLTEENQIDENKEEENKVENKINNEIEEENKVSNSTSDAKEESLTSKEKAIALVKKEWGENDNTVYYYVEEQISDDEFIISVRDQNTTEDLSSYKVDVSSESLEKE